jgi:hypothetical protein
MTRKIYKRILKLSNEMKNLDDSHCILVYKTSMILLNLIDNKNDVEFEMFFIQHILNFQLKKAYYNSISKKMFSSFHDISDFINKIKYTNSSEFYVELIDYLTTIKNLTENKEELVIQNQSCCNKTIMRLIKDISLFKKKKKDEKEVNEEKDDKKNEEKKREKKKKKQAISSTMKRLVWNTHIGEEIGKSKCLCCNTTDITQLSFHCGHIIAEAIGGETNVSNLRPICQNCNSSMGTKNMNDFMKTLK